jgi:hypothetical protein
MDIGSVVWKALVGCAIVVCAQYASAANVKVTPLGGQEGEFCPQDRALVFEDPNGTRILYDPGRTVAGGTDPRLGKIDIILVSHMHGDHVGNAHAKAPNAGSCAKPDTSVSAVPNTNAVNIALAKKAKIVTGSEMPPFFHDHRPLHRPPTVRCCGQLTRASLSVIDRTSPGTGPGLNRSDRARTSEVSSLMLLSMSGVLAATEMSTR